MIKYLKIEGWNQFDKIDLNFHPKVTILTGANGSGKSTLLKLLSREMGWNYEATATPLNSKELQSSFVSGISLDKLLFYIKKRANEDKSVRYEYNIDDDSIEIGEIELENDRVKLYVPEDPNGASYEVYSVLESKKEIEKDLEPGYAREGLYVSSDDTIKGVSIASHRQSYAYTEIKNIPVKTRTKKQMHEEYLESLKKRLLPNYYYSDEVKSPIHNMKASLMSLALFGEGNKFVEKDNVASLLFSDFVRILRRLLPENLGFENLQVKNGEIVLETKSGNFFIDAVSGGIGSIIDLAWQIFVYDNDGESFVVLIDEIENHLHPSMQRLILPNLLHAFPNAQFIITTHSPFVVNSVADSWVYALRQNNKKHIEAELLDFESKSSNALEILKEILGVPVTLPIWIEDKLNSILDNYRNVKLTPELYIQLKEDLKEYGLDQHLPQALGELSRGEGH